MDKKKIVVLFGGQSSEHVVSCMSVVNVVSSMDTHKYDLLLLGITEEGHWVRAASVEDIRSGAWRESEVEAVLSPDAVKRCIILSQGGVTWEEKVDAAFPVLHGPYGEDGTVQGLFELARLPYVGCGVLASAVSMDKLFTKTIVDRLGIRQAAYVPVTAWEMEEDMDGVVAGVEERLPYPMFIKPSSAGSSRGVTKAEDRGQLVAGLREAARYSCKILAEEAIVGHEVECAVLGGGPHLVHASGVGEILPAAGFYDFDAKYYNEESRTVVNPELPGDAAKRVRDAAVRVFCAVDGYGLARVDFFVTDEGEVVFNEINTMPGFTAISMYPTLWEAEGMSKEELVDELIRLAFARP